MPKKKTDQKNLNMKRQLVKTAVIQLGLLDMGGRGVTFISNLFNFKHNLSSE